MNDKSDDERDREDEAENDRGGDALVNDPSRALADWDDIRMLLQAAGQRRQAIDWALLMDYLRLFEMEHRLGELKSIYGTVE